MEIYNNILNFDELSSTNAHIFELIKENNIAEFTTVRAINQTQGKGQRGNMWLSEHGKNATFSILFKPLHIKVTHQFIISQLVSLAIQNVLSHYCQHVTIKWPNDIYVNDKKICGILIENVLQKSSIQYCVVGIGININQCVFDSSIPNPTSLKLETGKDFDVQTLIKECVLTSIKYYTSVLQNSDRIKNEYFELLYKKGKTSLFEDAQGEFFGEIMLVNSDGKLWIKDSNGNSRSYYFKEVVYK